MEHHLHATQGRWQPFGCLRARSGAPHEAPDDGRSLPPEPQPHADGEFRLLRRCLRLAVELAGVAGVHRIHYHHAPPSAQRGEAASQGFW